MRGACLNNAVLKGADLSVVDLRGAILHATDFSGAKLTGADLRGADMNCTIMVNTTLAESRLTGALVYEVSAWDIRGEPGRTNVILIRNQTRRAVKSRRLGRGAASSPDYEQPKHPQIFNSLTGRAVLLLGRFTEDRKEILETIRAELRDQRGHALNHLRFRAA